MKSGGLGRILAVVLLAAVLGISAPAGADVDAQPATVSPKQVAEQVWDLVDRHFLSRDVTDGPWDTARTAYLDTLAGDAGEEETAAVIDAMLASLNTSHVGRYTSDQTDYYDLLDIFADNHSRAIDSLFDSGEVAYVGIDIDTVIINGRIFVAGVHQGGPADQAGVLVGDEVLAVGGATFSEVDAFRGLAGQETALTVRRRADAAPIEIMVTPQRLRPSAAYRRALRRSARVIEIDSHNVGYVRVWSYAGEQYHEALVALLSDGVLADTDALVLDLRGGWGGAWPDYAELFIGGAPSLTIVERSGYQRYSAFRWRKPLVVLVDGGTRSGKEVLAHAFQQHGIPLVGTTTAGAVVAGRPFILDDDSLLYLAVADVLVDGIRLEGVGVEPDIVVPFDIRYAAGIDPQRDVAFEVAVEALR